MTMDGSTSVKVCAFLCLVAIATVGAGGAGYPGRGDLCSRVRCAAPQCPNPVRDPRGCCLICPKRPGPDCTLVDCRPIVCKRQWTPPNQCCPICKPVGGRRGCRVGNRFYSEGETIPTKDACQRCVCLDGRMSCDGIMCPMVWCPGQFRVPGQCCPSCPPGSGGGEVI